MLKKEKNITDATSIKGTEEYKDEYGPWILVNRGKKRSFPSKTRYNDASSGVKYVEKISTKSNVVDVYPTIILKSSVENKLQNIEFPEVNGDSADE